MSIILIIQYALNTIIVCSVKWVNNNLENEGPCLAYSLSYKIQKFVLICISKKLNPKFNQSELNIGS